MEKLLPERQCVKGSFHFPPKSAHLTLNHYVDEQRAGTLKVYNI